VHLRVAATLFLQQQLALDGAQQQQQQQQQQVLGRGRRLYTDLGGERPLDRGTATEVRWEGGPCGAAARAAPPATPAPDERPAPRPLQAALEALEGALALQVPAEQQCEFRVAHCETSARMYALLAEQAAAAAGAGGRERKEAEAWMGRVRLCVSALVRSRECAEQAQALLPLAQQLQGGPRR
jgi:hypothetical protein